MTTLALDRQNDTRTRLVAVLAVAFAVMLLSCDRPSPDKSTPHTAVSTLKGPTYRVGYMICNSEQDTLRRFRPLTAYLSQKLGVKLEAVAIDTVDYLKHVDELHFTHTNSLLYINMHRFHGVEIVAAERSEPGKLRAAGAVVALKKRGFKTLTDLAGKKMVFGPSLGPISYMTQMDLLQKAGVDPDDDLAFYSIPSGSFKHEKVVYGVLFEKYDAGAVPLRDLNRMVASGKIQRDDFQVLATGEPILYCNFASTQKVDDALAKRFQSALVGVNHESTAKVDGETVKVLARAEIDGFEVVKDAAFKPVRDMARRTNMPPYQKY